MARKASTRRPVKVQRGNIGGLEPRISVVFRSIEELRPDPANPREHSKKQIKQIAHSIEAFGFNVPVLVDAELKVVAGHGRLLACRELGWTEVPTISLDHLTATGDRFAKRATSGFWASIASGVAVRSTPRPIRC